ncbi:MAG TPA: glycosyl hydrolase 115 family protein, partial [Microbacterium sp.]|nr:glycosyl hydrolase 115 family protein [Microbacterium sp.]
VGMRGVHDTGFVTAAIDDDGDMTETEKTRARVELLETVIRDQRALLAETLRVDPSTPPQLFIPYKEVLPLYDAGLRVPDDVTVVWANDNFGYIRRFPSESERTRPGGHGLYYHSSYWSNMTTSYLATSSTSLALMKSELRKAWDRGIRRLWVDNIGGLKPLEIEMDFFLRSAWEAGKESSTADVEEFVAEWIDDAFSGGHGADAGRIYVEHSRLNSQRKIEHLGADVFAQTAYGDEAGLRLEELRELADRAGALALALPEHERDAFLQVFAFKVQLTYLVNAQFFYADRSTLAFRQGKAAAADRYLDLSRAFDAHKRTLIHAYNHTLSGGAWEGMFTPECFPPPVMPLHPAATPALSISGRGLGVVAWGEDEPGAAPRLTFWPWGAAEKWLEIFTTGAGAVAFELDADPWIALSQTAGSVEGETRIAVRIADPAAHAGRIGAVRVRDVESGRSTTVPVTVAAASVIDEHFRGSVEADGYVSLDAALPDRIVAGAGARWRPAPHLGRYGGHAMAVEASAGDAPAGTEARLEFDVHLHTAGRHLLELHRLPTLNATGSIRVGVSVDGHPPVIVESASTDEHRGDWERGVQDNVERLTVRLPHLDAGAHEIRLHAVDADVTLSKVVVYTQPPQRTALGPAFSAHTGRARPATIVPHPESPRLDALGELVRRLYRVDADAVPLPSQVYAGRGFHEGDTTFRPAHAVPQTSLGAPRYGRAADGTKDVRAQIGLGVVREAGGILAWEAEYALAGDATSWTTAGDGPRELTWSHTQAETDGRTGLAMHVVPRGVAWEDPHAAPAMHYAIEVASPGRYAVWLLMKFDDRTDDALTLALDGVVQPESAQFGHDGFCTYGTRQLWVWTLVSDLDIDAGRHVVSVLARKSGLRIDRLYLTLGSELPPVDAEWRPSARTTPLAEAPAPTTAAARASLAAR